MRLHRVIRPWHARGLAIERILAGEHGVSPLMLGLVLSCQVFFNLLFTSRAAYLAFRSLSENTGMPDPTLLGLFYADVPPGPQMPETIHARDLVDGTPYTTTVAELFEKASRHAATMMEAAFAYRRGTIGRERLIDAIPGVSLDTGRLGVSVASIHSCAADGCS